MRYVARCSVALALVLLLLSGLVVGCSSDNGETTVKDKVKIGFVTDLTGPLSGMTKDLVNPMEDAVKYANEEAPVQEGLIFEVVYGDQKSDDSLNVQIYNLLKERGCPVIVSATAPFADTVKPFVERDQVFVLSMAVSEEQINPPQWIFAVTSPVYGQVQTMLKWISEEDWDYVAEGRKPKLGAVVWDESYETEMVDAARDYVAANADEFELGPAIVTPLLTYTFTAEIEQVKDCDYLIIPQISTAPAQFAKDFRDRGYTATFLGTEALTGYKEIILEKAGWSYLDGTLTSATSPYWTDDYPIIEEAWAALVKYHGEAEAQSLRNVAYCSNYPTTKMLMEVLARAVSEKGSADITGQDVYDAAVGYSSDLEGVTREFSDTDRIWRDSLAVYEWRAADQDLFRVTDWMPIAD